MHQILIPSWLANGPRMRLSRPDVTKTALIIVDMQIVFVQEGQMFASQHSADIIPNINQLAEAVREGGGKVIYTRHVATDQGPRAIPAWKLADPMWKQYLYDAFLPDRPECQLDSRMNIQPSDLIVDKYRYGAFALHSSDLHERLQEVGADTVIVVGVTSNCCCETTARDASQIGYKTFFITDGTAAMTDDEHNAALINLGVSFADLRSTDEMLELLS